MPLTEVVGDRTYATLQLLAACQQLAPRITVRTGCGGMRPSMIRPHPRVLRCEQQTVALSNRFAIETTSGLSGEPVNPRHTRTCVLSLSASQDPNKTTDTDLLPVCRDHGKKQPLQAAAPDWHIRFIDAYLTDSGVVEAMSGFHNDTYLIHGFAGF